MEGEGESGERRIVLVVSDLHLGTGAQEPDGTNNPRDAFRFDQQFAQFLEYHRTGEYRSCRVELVINGDFIEGLHPEEDWDDPDMITETRALDLTRAVLRGHRVFFGALAQFVRDERRQVVITVGNHDQLLVFPRVQEAIVEAVGEVRFVIGVYRPAGGVHIEHGHQLEPMCRYDEEHPIIEHGVPEPILRLPLGSDFVVSWVNKLMRLRHYADRIRPLRLLISWSFIHDFRFAVWTFYTFIATLIASRFRKHRPRRRPIWRSLWTMFLPNPVKTLEAPAREILAEDPDVGLVVLGHSHSPMHRTFPGGGEYINTGSWIEHISLHPGSLGRHLRMTFARLDLTGPEVRGSLQRWYGRYQLEVEYHR